MSLPGVLVLTSSPGSWGYPGHRDTPGGNPDQQTARCIVAGQTPYAVLFHRVVHSPVNNLCTARLPLSTEKRCLRTAPVTGRLGKRPPGNQDSAMEVS